MKNGENEKMLLRTKKYHEKQDGKTTMRNNYVFPPILRAYAK